MDILFDHGEKKFPRAAVVGSSASLGWCGVATEVRSHPACALPPFTSAETEVTISLRGRHGAWVRRSSGGVRQQTSVREGTVWITPGGSHEEETEIERPLDDVAHIYLSNELMTSLHSDEAMPGRAPSIDYLADVQDNLIRQIGWSLVSEMRAPTAGGKVLAESLGVTLAARILQRHSTAAIARAKHDVRERGRTIDDVRVRRVIDYMMAHLEDPVGLADLAAVACLSQYHFVRTFRLKAGLPPYQFLSRLRLQHAKTLLGCSDRAISDIALACQFSSQSNFTRAFREFTGNTPKQFRQLT